MASMTHSVMWRAVFLGLTVPAFGGLPAPSPAMAGLEAAGGLSAVQPEFGSADSPGKPGGASASPAEGDPLDSSPVAGPAGFVLFQGGDTCGTATAIASLPASVTGTTVGYTDDYDEVCPFPGSTSPDVAYSYTPGNHEVIDITLCAGDTDYDSKVYVYAGACPGTLVACNDDACTSAIGQLYVSQLSNVALTAGTTYYIVVDGYAGASGTYFMDITASPDCNTNGVPDEYDVTAFQLAKLTAADAAYHDHFGFSTSLSGDTTVVGAHWDEDAGVFTGSAYVFVRSGGVWTQQAKLTAADATAGDNFGYSVSVSGDTVVIGAVLADDAGSASGSAYVFVRSGGVWTQQAKLTAADAAAGDLFGFGVAVVGDTAVVGATGDDDACPGDPDCGSGSAYVFVRSSGVWTQQAKLTAADAAAGDQFGGGVSLSEDTALIGAVRDDDACPGDPDCDSGSAYVFVRSGGVWTQQAKLTAPDAAAEDYFGHGVSVSGDTAVVGAYGDDDAGTYSGSAYVFIRSGGVWTQQAKLTATDATTGDWFGFGVAVVGDTAVVGASIAFFGGAAYVFVRSGGVWTQQAKLTAADAAAFDGFGISVALSGATAVVGAYLDDDTCPGDPDCNSGSTYVFSVPISPDCSANGIPDECEPDCNANGAADSCDIAFGTSADCQPDGVPDECQLVLGVVPPPPADAQDDCLDAMPVCPGVLYSGTTAGATNDGSASCAVSAGCPDVWYVYTPADNGTVTISLCGSAYDTAISVHSGCPGTEANELACNDDFCGLQSQVSVPVAAGTSYLIRVSGYSCLTGDFVMELTGPFCQEQDPGTDNDCNDNQVPDDCDVLYGTSADCNSNGVPDECDTDCNADGFPDDCDVAAGTSDDCNSNGVPDECDLSAGASRDCNANGVPDECDVAGGTSADCQPDGFPDECQAGHEPPPDPCAAPDALITIDILTDANPDQTTWQLVEQDVGVIAGGGPFTSPGVHEIAEVRICSTHCYAFTIFDSFGDGICCGDGLGEYHVYLDGVEVGSGGVFTLSETVSDLTGGCGSPDCNSNGVPDECELAAGSSADCNANGIPDECDIAAAASADCQPNGVPDECEVTAVVYSNMIPSGPVSDEVFTGGAGVFRFADDLSLVGTERAVRNVKAQVAGLGAAYDVTATLFDGCPYDGAGAAIASSTVSGVPGGETIQEISFDFPFVEVPTNLYLELQFSEDDAGWMFGGPVDQPGEVGFTDNRFGQPECAVGTCLCWFGGSPYAGFRCEVAVGASHDCNTNGTPDECEADCNSNGLADECEGLLAPDLDGDGDVDLFDYSLLTLCFGGDGVPVAPNCICSDLDGDGDVDLGDAAVLVAAMTGP